MYKLGKKICLITLSAVFVLFLVACDNPLASDNASNNNGDEDPPPQVASPQFSPAGGSYDADQSVTLSSATEGASIYYTTDGMPPDTGSTLYTAPIEVAGDGANTTIRAIAAKDGMSDSEVVEASYSINYAQVASPQFSPAGGSYAADQSVTLSSATEGASIYYTTDGTPPDTGKTLYTAPIEVAGDGANTIIRAIAAKDGMSDSEVVEASYSIVYRYVLTTETSGSGSILVEPDEASYPSGTEVTLTAQPETGWLFERWEGDLSGSSNPAAVTMSADTTVSAVFVQQEYELTVIVDGSGIVVRDPDASSYTAGESVELTAEPAEGHQFHSWSGDLAGTSNPVSIVMDADKTVTAVFVPLEYNLSVGTRGNGSVSIDPELSSYSHGTSVTLTATPDSGNGFSHWESSGSVVSTQNPYSFTIDEDLSLTAVFLETAQVEGFWIGEAEEDGSADPPFPFTMYVLQDGTNLTGYGVAGWAEGPLQGEVLGNNIDIIIEDDNTLSVEGQVQVDGSVSGTWEYTFTTGTFDAILPPEATNPFIGTWEMSITDTDGTYTINYTFNNDHTVEMNAYSDGVHEGTETGIYEYSSEYGVLGLYFPSSVDGPYMEAYYYSISGDTLFLDGFWGEDEYTKQ